MDEDGPRSQTFRLQNPTHILWIMKEVCPQLLHYSEEKIGLAQQIYDYVDQRIRRLDKDLKAFETDIAKERARLGIPVSTQHHPHLGDAEIHHVLLHGILHAFNGASCFSYRQVQRL